MKIPASHRHVAWLDGLRGVAAMQVMAMHYVDAFLPASLMFTPDMAHIGWAGLVARMPFYVAANGNGAVYLFFIMSGAVLTRSFSRQPVDFGRTTLRRAIRLGVPAAAGLLLGGLLIALWPHAHIGGTVLGGAADLHRPLPHATAPAVLHQMALEGMLTGYRNFSLLPDRLAAALGLAPLLSGSFDGPVWTLHLEFFGSLLVLLLVAVAAACRRALSVGCVGGAFVVALLWNPLLSLFIIGHVLTPLLGGASPNRRYRVVGWVCLLVGIAMSADLASPLPGEVLIFVGVGLLPMVQRWLGGALAQRLGTLSFSIYLVHFPLLLTVVSLLFRSLARSLPYDAALAVCVAFGVPLTLVVAVLFERLVDRPAILLSRSLRGRMLVT
jgi:peptidoglycan/LPS O-acetylase OafA/YrhL